MKTYSITDEKGAIKDLQRMLGIIYEKEGINQNGIYDDKTKNAVISFQKDLGLKVTGRTDWETFNLLSKKFNSAMLSKKTRESNKEIQFPISHGAFGLTVLNVNHMLKKILDYYGIAHNVRSTFTYNFGTVDGVYALRKIYRMTSGDEIDELLFNMMVLDFEDINRKASV